MSVPKNFDLALVVGHRMPHMIEISVVLPDPLSPTR